LFETQITQDGNSLAYDSTCDTPPESPLFRPTFPQAATGPVDLATGEWMLSGIVEIPDLSPIEYHGEGVFSADGQSYTGFTTAGFSAGGNLTEWLSTTTGDRVD